MIEFKLLDECEDCPEFDVRQDSHSAVLFDGRVICQHTVTWEHLEKCRNLIAHLRKEGNNYGNNR